MNPLKNKAIKLRKAGYSYSAIREKLGIAKSTLSNWLASVPFKPNKETVERVGRAKLKSALYRQKSKFDDIRKMKTQAIKEVGEITSRDIFMLGVGLYLGEGSKSIEEVKISNSDPTIITLAIKWLKTFCNLNTNHFRITIHGYPDTDPRACVRFWSQQTKIPREQFGKIVIDNRKNKSNLKKRSLPYGTAHLYVRSGGTLSPGVKSLHRKIIGWIEAVMKQL